jgi:hypothetical protein
MCARWIECVVASCLLSLLVLAGPVRCARAEAAGDDGDFARAPSWSIPSADDVRRRLLEWLTAESAAGRVPTAAAAAIDASWSADQAGESRDLLDRVMAALVQADPRCAAARRDVDSAMPADTGWLDEAATATFERDAVKLWLGRERVRQDRFDEGLSLLADLDPAVAVDPAALLFHRAACQHWMLEADQAAGSLDRLLERAGEIPVRYERVARLLRSDLAGLEDESLDHIARRMRDVTRRLDQGRAGPRTIAVQEGVIESLDKLIKAVEQQQQQQQQQCQASGGSGGGRGGSATPLDDSRIAGGKGPGEVTKKDIGEGDGWGKLPPHQREEALQQIGREFPAHYREAIEHYFKRLASGEEKRP